MADLTIFAFESAAVRTLNIEGEPWFVATDIAKILGYRDAVNMSRMLDDDEKDTHIVSTPGGEQELTIINESGLYACILKSRRPEAKAFRKWVTSEVLPSIRKRGVYVAPGASPAGPQFVTGNLSHGADLAVAADRTFRGFLRTARAAGLALPQALRVANQQTLQRTGMNMLAELDLDPEAAVENPAGACAAQVVLEEDPVFQAVAQWEATATPGHLYSMAVILHEALGVEEGDKRWQRLAPRVGRWLRPMGWTHRKMRHGGKPCNIWWKG